MILGRQIVQWVVGCGWLLAAACVVAEAPKAERMSGPSVRISLDSIHAPVVSANFLQAGASMLTLNVLDDTHLLVTFATRDLVPRLPNDPKDDEDRIVAAEIVELPDGKVLATTKWHLHDHARYLWPIGEGRFVVRMGSSLSLMAPMPRMARPETAKTPFERVALPHQAGMPVAVVRSADAELMSVITEMPLPKNRPVVLGDVEAPKRMYATDFYRVHESADGLLQVTGAGAVVSDAAFALPMDADGYLWPVDDAGHGHWQISFNGFGGQVLKAGAVDSSCAPRMAMASRSEYLALVCRGSDDKPKLMAMGLDGYEPWEENFGEFSETPSFVFAPAAGRFAMLYTTTVSVPASGAVEATESTNQEVRVYQTESGDLLQKVPCSPAFRVPENFDLSSSGRTLAVLHEDEILVFTLPELTKKDRADMAEVAKFRPPPSEAPVTLARMVAKASEPATTEKALSEKQALAVPESTTTKAAQALPGGPEAATSGDTGKRKRPTLLNPGEVPEFKDKTAPVQ